MCGWAISVGGSLQLVWNKTNIEWVIRNTILSVVSCRPPQATESIEMTDPGFPGGSTWMASIIIISTRLMYSN